MFEQSKPEGRVLKISSSTGDFYQYWNGGCSFHGTVEPLPGEAPIVQFLENSYPLIPVGKPKILPEDIEVLARYENGEAAAIKGSNGKGIVCLIGGHPEENGVNVPSIILDGVTLLENTKTARFEFMKNIFETLNITAAEPVSNQD
jgi:glutamine amidotransferase-like uncharacterized protein